MENVLFARQAIFDKQFDVIAYELLFRPNSESLSAGPIDGDNATSKVILNALTEANFSELTQNKPAFINFTSHWLLNPPPLDKADIVIEVLENVEVNQDINEALKSLEREGYTLALDDFIYDQAWDSALACADIVKVDVLAHNINELPAIVEKLRCFNVKLLAEKVEDQTMLTQCQALNFDFYQGYFFCKPQIIKGKGAHSNQTVLLQLLEKLSNPDISFEALEEIISIDPTLSYKLLRLANSAAYRTDQNIESIKQAMTRMGIQHIKTWVTLISLSQVENKPQELMASAILRAKMCELLASRAQLEPPEKYFMIGLLSLIDAIMDKDMEEVLSEINFTDNFKSAILKHEGIAGAILATTICHEQAHWNDIKWNDLSELNLYPEIIEQSYLESIHWQQQTLSQIQEPRPVSMHANLRKKVPKRH